MFLLQCLTCWVRLEQCLTIADSQYCSKSESLWAVQTKMKCLRNPCWPGWKIKWSSLSSKGSIVDNSGPHQFITLSPGVWGQSLWSLTLALSSSITIMSHITLKMCSLKTELLNQLLMMLVSNVVLLNSIWNTCRGGGVCKQKKLKDWQNEKLMFLSPIWKGNYIIPSICLLCLGNLSIYIYFKLTLKKPKLEKHSKKGCRSSLVFLKVF